MWCFAASTRHAGFAPCRSGEVCQLVARHLLQRRAVGLSHRLHQWCVLPSWLWSQVRRILCEGCELPRSFLDCVCTLFGSQPHRCRLARFCPHCNSFPLEDCIWWVSTRHGDSRNKKQAMGGVRYVEADTIGEHQTGYRWCSSVLAPTKQKCSERTTRVV